MSRIALVTGGSRGIGAAISTALQAAGYTVAATYAGNDEKAAAFTAETGIKTYKWDVSDYDACAAGIAAVEADLGPVDILVNNAGGAGDLQPVANLSDEAFDECMKWNVYSTFWGIRKALQLMLPQKWGRIINISSMEGKHGKPVLTAYTAAKHAVNGMTKSIAREVGTEGITVNAICPGLIITDIVKDNGPKTAEAMGMTFDEMVTTFSQEAAIQRPNTVEEVAAVAVLLASDVGGGITGALMSVDGGTAQY